MAPREPSAAQALYGHLPSAARPEVKQRPGTLGDALWPSLTPKPPPNWHREDIALIQRARGSDAEVARRYGVSKQVVGQIRKLGR
jgi:hypothetical protein